MKPIGRRLFADRYNTPLFGFAIAALVFTVLAYCVHSEHFWFHVYIEGAVASVTLFLTVWIVEDLLEYRRDKDRREQWAVVRENTMMMLRSCVARMCTDAADIILGDNKTYDGWAMITGMEKSATKEASAELKKVVEKLREIYQSPCPPNSDPRQERFEGCRVIAWHQSSRVFTQLLRGTVMTRLLQFAPNHQAMKGLLQLEMELLEIENPDVGIQAEGEPIRDIFVLRIIETCQGIYESCVIAQDSEEVQ